MGQFYPRWNKSETLWDQTSVHFSLPSQSILKSDQKKSQICPICGKYAPLWALIWHPWTLLTFWHNLSPCCVKTGAKWRMTSALAKWSTLQHQAVITLSLTYHYSLLMWLSQHNYLWFFLDVCLKKIQNSNPLFKKGRQKS